MIIFKPGFILSTNAHLDAAIHNKAIVMVWQQGEILDYGGQIVSHSADAVMINGERYLKATCEFRIR